MRRWLLFVLAILIGIGLGLFYGLVINPSQYTNTTLDKLKIDYKTDYILMLAEAYKADRDIGLAMARLDWLDTESPASLVRQAVAFAEQVGYTDHDLELMRILQVDLEVILGTVETPSP